MSPDALLRQRKGNCFEMATLLCSLLIGHGFDAYVVCGYAVREVTRNNQYRVVCPAIALKLEERERRLAEEKKEIPEDVLPRSKYQLKDPIDLKSKFLRQLDDEERQRVADKEDRAAAEETDRVRIEEALPLDELLNKRVHSWVLVKGKGEAFFIEPATGFRHSITDPSYIGIESVWNHENYVVNKQKEIVGGIEKLHWNLLDREHWERLLDVDSDYPESVTVCAKYLDMPLSWVSKLEVSNRVFEERFPGQQQKVIRYKRAVHEKFAVYKEVDGVVERIKKFEDLQWERPLKMWEYFANRADLLNERVTDHSTRETMEFFDKGRQDALKSVRRFVGVDNKVAKEFQFYSKLRFDCLKKIEMSSLEMKEFYWQREDRLRFRHFRFSEDFDPKDIRERINCLEFVEENFDRDLMRPALGDISIRKLLFLDNKIILQYHYEDYYITATTREFVKPPKPSYGEEIRFDPQMTKSYKSNADQPDPSNIELYELLLDQLAAETEVIQSFIDRCDDMQHLKITREKETRKSLLTFSIFDPLRNEDAKGIRRQRLQLIAMREESARREKADYLGPYLLKHSMALSEVCTHMKKGSISLEASKRAFDDCLKDFQEHQLATLKDVQRMLDETNEEVVKFKEFIVKFKDHFTAENIENITKEGEGLQRYKHILQKRLTELRKESKMQKFQNELLNDERLNPQFKEILKLSV